MHHTLCCMQFVLIILLLYYDGHHPSCQIVKYCGRFATDEQKTGSTIDEVAAKMIRRNVTNHWKMELLGVNR